MSMRKRQRSVLDVEVLAILYAKPNSGRPPLKIVRAIAAQPLSPCVLFDRGNPAALAALLRSSDALSPDIREFVAGIVDGTVKRPRGNKRLRGLSPRDVSWMRWVAANAKANDVTYRDVLRALAKFYKRSEGNVRDVLERRGAYAEK